MPSGERCEARSRFEVMATRAQLHLGFGGGGGDGAGAQPSQSHEEHATPHWPEPPQAQLQKGFGGDGDDGDDSSSHMTIEAARASTTRRRTRIVEL